MRITYLQIVKNLFINSSTFLIGVIVSVIIPIRFGHVLCPIAEPLQSRPKSIVMDTQMPVEMVLCHILLPTLIEKMHYKAVFKNILKVYFQAMTHLLDLQWIASNEVFPNLDDNNEAPENTLLPPIPAPPAIAVIQNTDVNHESVVQNDDTSPSSAEFRDEPSSSSSSSLYPSSTTVDVGVTMSTVTQKSSSDDVTSVNIVNDDSIESPSQPLPSSSLVISTTFSASDISNTISRESLSDSKITSNITTKALQVIRGTSQTTRLSLFIVFGMLLFAIISSWLLHGPLTVGRNIIDMLHVSTDNDVFNYPVGLAFCGAIAFVLNFIIQDLVLNRNIFGMLQVVWKWAYRALQFMIVGIYWLVIPPFMLGVIFESLFLNPVRGNTSMSSFSLLECWAFGLIGLKIWTQCVLVGMFGEIEMRVSLEVIVMRGFAQFDAWYCIRNVVFPVSMILLDFSLAPYLISLTLQKGQHFIPLGLTPFTALFHHWRYHVYVSLRMLLLTCQTTFKSIVQIHRQVRDSKYLIGTQLHNRPDGDPLMTSSPLRFGQTMPTSLSPSPLENTAVEASLVS